MVQPLYAWPHGAESEAHTAVLAQILRDSFKQSGTTIKDDAAIISAARHIVQSEQVALTIKNP